MCKQMSSSSFKNVMYELFVYKPYIEYMYKEDLALNNLQQLISHKTQLTNLIIFILIKLCPIRNNKILVKMEINFI